MCSKKDYLLNMQIPHNNIQICFCFIISINIRLHTELVQIDSSEGMSNILASSLLYCILPLLLALLKADRSL